MPQAIIDKIFHNPRIGLCLLLIANKDASMNRSDYIVSFDKLGLGSYLKTLRQVLRTVGIKPITILFTAIGWDLANREKE